MNEKKTLTTGEIAKHCDVSFQTVLRWIKRGEIKAFQLPGRGDNRVNIQDFLDFLGQNDLPIPDEFQHDSRRVLIVDDEPSMAKTIQRILKRSGFETVIASDGFQAGALLGTFRPAVMTLDLMMPGVSGFEVLKFVRRTENIKDTRILVVSAMPENDLKRALRSGADEYLEKPFKRNELLARVQELMEVYGKTKGREKDGIYAK